MQVLLLVAEQDGAAMFARMTSRSIGWWTRRDRAALARPLRWSRSTGKKIGDAWGITGRARVDRTTAALRYYGLLEYQGGWQGARV